MKLQLLRESGKNFRRDEDGAATVEYVLWLPILVILIILPVDVALTMQAHARMYDAARYAARSVAVGQSTAVAAETDALSTLQGAGSFTVSVDDSASDRVTVSVLGSNTGLTAGIFDLFDISLLRADYVMRKES